MCAEVQKGSSLKSCEEAALRTDASQARARVWDFFASATIKSVAAVPGRPLLTSGGQEDAQRLAGWHLATEQLEMPGKQGRAK